MKVIAPVNSKYSLRSVLDWLRAGYPEGIPAKDHFALLAVLGRRLTDEEIGEIVELSIATAHEHPDRHVDYDALKSIIAGVIQKNPPRKTSAGSPSVWCGRLARRRREETGPGSTGRPELTDRVQEHC